jgi:hypothetical protein
MEDHAQPRGNVSWHSTTTATDIGNQAVLLADEGFHLDTGAQSHPGLLEHFLTEMNKHSSQMQHYANLIEGFQSRALQTVNPSDLRVTGTSESSTHVNFAQHQLDSLDQTSHGEFQVTYSWQDTAATSFEPNIQNDPFEEFTNIPDNWDGDLHMFDEVPANTQPGIGLAIQSQALNEFPSFSVVNQTVSLSSGSRINK